MKARPILFSGPMVRAQLEGRKSQTRRAVKPQPPPAAKCAGVIHSCSESNGIWSWLDAEDLMDAGVVADHFRCPFGIPGDVLWVRESWRVGKRWDLAAPRDLHAREMTVMFSAGGSVANNDRGQYVLDESYPETLPDWAGKLRPGIFMPRWASRLTLRLTDVRVERLQEISEADALAEGVAMPESGREERDESLCSKCGGTLLVNRVHPNGGMMFDCDCTDCDTAHKRYRHLWNYINGPDAWEANPWVWALAFAVEKRNVDEVLKEAA